jgi:hypothetical protein
MSPGSEPSVLAAERNGNCWAVFVRAALKHSTCSTISALGRLSFLPFKLADHMVGAESIELSTFRLRGGCSSQLSYTPKWLAR